MYSWIFLSFSRQLTLRLQVRKRGRKHRERAFLPTPDSDLCIGGRVKKCPPACQYKTAPIADLSSKTAANFSSVRTMKRFPSPRCASAIPIVRALESTAQSPASITKASVEKLRAITATHSISHSSPTDVFRSSNKYLRRASVPVWPATASVPEP